MSLNLNKVILSGRLTADPELKQTQSGLAVCSFRIAVNRRAFEGGEQEADFFTVTAWRQTAEFVAKYFRKGSAICVTGSIQNRTWTDKQGTNHFSTDIVADEAHFVESKAAATSAPTTQAEQQTMTPKFEEVNTDEGLPF